MKFVCNNCGFTADIPEKMSVCPMCGSSNVSSAAETSKFSTDAEENEDENAKAQHFKAAAGPTQRVTLTEGMNVEAKSDSSSKKRVLRSEKKTREIGRKSKVPLVVILLLLVVAAAAAAGFFFFFK
ncbi:hypothetical protein II898_08620 [bacterium]|nr:hypothetical protein [bacterium]